MTSIEWVRGADGAQGKTWNPVAGCSVHSPGCKHCYAMPLAARLERMGVPHYAGLTSPTKAGPVFTGKVVMAPEKTLLAPLRRRKPTTYFVNSMSDLFHEGLTDAQIDRVFAVMALCPQHIFQVLTKRSARMRAWASRIAGAGHPVRQLVAETCARAVELNASPAATGWCFCWPLPNVWLGVSAEDQQRADERVPDLLATPATIRFVSTEPLLGRINFRTICAADDRVIDALHGRVWGFDDRSPKLDWIIVGGESGPDARPMHPEWERVIREACAHADVAYFRKQWGAWKALASNDGDWPVNTPKFIRLRPDGTHGPDGWPMQLVGKKAAGRLLDGRTHDAVPEVRP